jgi:hypothetical protein
MPNAGAGEADGEGIAEMTLTRWALQLGVLMVKEVQVCPVGAGLKLEELVSAGWRKRDS